MTVVGIVDSPYSGYHMWDIEPAARERFPKLSNETIEAILLEISEVDRARSPAAVEAVSASS